MVFVNPYSDLHFGGPFSRGGGVFGSKKIKFNDQIKKCKCPGNVFRVHIYINTALDMFNKNMRQFGVAHEI